MPCVWTILTDSIQIKKLKYVSRKDNSYMKSNPHPPYTKTTTKNKSMLTIREFKNAKAFARGLGLKGAREWKEYCKSGKKPSDIPYHPEVA